MSKIKGLKKVNKKVTKIFRKEWGIRKVALGDDFEYNFVKDRVQFKITHSIEDELFNKFVAERFGLNLNAESGFLFSLLHEVGHRENNDDIDGGVYQFCIDEKNRISAELRTNPTLTYDETYALESQYFNLPDEIMATAWAVNFLKENPQKSAKMYKKIAKILQKFYKMNEIEG